MKVCNTVDLDMNIDIVMTFSFNENKQWKRVSVQILKNI